MVWGTFTITHILSLLLGAAIIIGLYFALKNRTEKTQIFDKFFCSRKAAEDMAKWLRACGHSAVKIVSLTQE